MKVMLSVVFCVFVAGCYDPEPPVGRLSSAATGSEPVLGCGWNPDDTDPDVDPAAVEDYTGTQTERPVTCGWDRCGPSGGYVCTDGYIVCVWHRGTTWIECGEGCIKDSQAPSSCYSCSARVPW